jgi:hypothetical protein
VTRAPIVLLVSIVVAGAAAAIRVSPRLWIATPIVAAVVYSGWRRSAASVSDELYAAFPQPMREKVESTLDRLPRGDARQLLSRILAAGAHVFEQPDATFDSVENESVRRNVEELVDACLTAAVELARLDEVSGRHSARALFVAKLSDAAHALGALYESGVRGGTPASHRVSELAAEINADARARTQAKQDLGRLLD